MEHKRSFSSVYSTLLIIGCIAGAILLIGSVAQAMQFSSTNYLIDTATINTVGGNSSSSNYQLTSSGGEAAIGNGASGSYKLAAGYAAQIITPAIIVKTEPSDIIGSFTLDENSGTVVHDTSTNSYLGSFVGTPSWTTGKLSTGLAFNGTDQAVTFNNSSQAAFTNGTVELWVKTSTSSGTQTIAGKHGSWQLGLNNGNPTFYNFSTSSYCTSTVGVADNNWHHVAVTFQDGVSNGSVMYVDGVQTQACTWTPLNQTGVVTLGAQYNGSTYSQYFAATLDHVKIFNRAMNSNEVLAEYTAQNAGVSSGLSLQTVVPGASNSISFSVITLTSGSSYSLAINQNTDLDNGTSTISGISGTIGSPLTWNEGTTKGLGFTLTNTNATAIPGSWGSGNAYAALPSSPTSFYVRTGIQPTGTKDVLDMELRVDTPPSQASGAYTNIMYITGTAQL